jgi:endonuclease/exonuclease/phosphatase family metal-dependent hydrolase
LLGWVTFLLKKTDLQHLNIHFGRFLVTGKCGTGQSLEKSILTTKKNNSFLVFVLLILLSFKASAELSLKLASMNVYMLPKPIKWTYQRERTEALLERLKVLNYDIILFQEAFQQSFRDTTVEKMKELYPYYYSFDKKNSIFNFFGSGLFILSRKPMKILDSVYFNDCASFDCFASKGAVLVQIELDKSKSVQIATTHLQAGPESADIRTKQLSQINEMLNKHKQNNETQLLIGDLNIDVSNPSFEKALAQTKMIVAPLNGDIKTTNARANECYDTPTQKLWIDHLWASDISNIHNWEIKVNDLNFELNQKTCPLSDHHAIEANLLF